MSKQTHATLERLTGCETCDSSGDAYTIILKVSSGEFCCVADRQMILGLIRSLRKLIAQPITTGEPSTISASNSLTVRQLIELLKSEDADAYVVTYHPKCEVTAIWAQGLDRLRISRGDREIPAIMLQ